MTDAERVREEKHFRKVEGAMLDVEFAARRLADATKELKRDGADPYLIAAMETATGAVRADHARFMKDVYWRLPSREEDHAAA